MPSDPSKCTLNSMIFEHGIREYYNEAKTLKLNPREGAFYCIYKFLQEFESLPASEQVNFPDLYGRGEMDNISAKQGLWRCITQEYNGVVPSIKGFKK